MDPNLGNITLFATSRPEGLVFKSDSNIDDNKVPPVATLLANLQKHGTTHEVKCLHHEIGNLSVPDGHEMLQDLLGRKHIRPGIAEPANVELLVANTESRRFIDKGGNVGFVKKLAYTIDVLIAAATLCPQTAVVIAERCKRWGGCRQLTENVLI